MSLLSKLSVQTDERSARLAGIGLMVFSVFMFSFGDALGKIEKSLDLVLTSRQADKTEAY